VKVKKWFYVSGKRYNYRERISLNFSDRKSAQRFINNLKRELKISIPQYRWVKSLKIEKV